MSLVFCLQGHQLQSRSHGWRANGRSCVPVPVHGLLLRDYERYTAQGLVFVRDPENKPYGTVAVFKDLYGNLWDLLEPKSHTGGSQ